MKWDQIAPAAAAYKAGWAEADKDIADNLPFRARSTIRLIAAEKYNEAVERDAFVVGYLQNRRR